ncbi:uncharacterized protein LOC135121232 [Zophobas morio]|uniref:uncharacterized protein LOC135121232 n=1 Tax=Zophobas morio TaxID=2755281 RepID=UPI003083CFFA
MNINSKVANSVQAASKVMAGANKSMNIHHVQKTMANYQKESELAGIRNELIEDTMNSLTEDNEEEEENVVNAILDEIGIDISSGLKAPSSSLPASEAADSEADLLARLQELKS